MKVLIIFSILLNLSLGLASKGNWKVIDFNDRFYLENTTKKSERFKIVTSGGRPSFVKQASKNGFDILVYYSGQAGTSHIISIYRALIVNSKTRAVLGDYPWKYNSAQKRKLDQPVWKFSKGEISIKDINYGIEKTIKLNK